MEPLWRNGAKSEGIILLEGMTITGLMEAGLRVRCSFIQTAPCADYLGVDGNKARVPVEEVSTFFLFEGYFFWESCIFGASDNLLY